jgi:hypothetical protein
MGHNTSGPPGPSRFAGSLIHHRSSPVRTRLPSCTGEHESSRNARGRSSLGMWSSTFRQVCVVPPFSFPWRARALGTPLAGSSGPGAPRARRREPGEPLGGLDILEHCIPSNQPASVSPGRLGACGTGLRPPLVAPWCGSVDWVAVDLAGCVPIALTRPTGVKSRIRRRAPSPLTPPAPPPESTPPADTRTESAAPSTAPAPPLPTPQATPRPPRPTAPPPGPALPART